MRQGELKGLIESVSLSTGIDLADAEALLRRAARARAQERANDDSRAGGKCTGILSTLVTLGSHEVLLERAITLINEEGWGDWGGSHL